MGDLDRDTEIKGGDGRYRATLSEDWQIWTPNGGYLSVIALRAAGAETRLRRPASLYVQLLRAPGYGPVDLEVETLRETKRTASARVTMSQDGQPVLCASTWIVDETLEGLGHEAVSMPAVPQPEALKSNAELQPEDWPFYPFWKNFDARPTHWVPREDRQPSEPVVRDWLRFVPSARFEDPFLEAGRAVVLCDTYTWPAAARAHGFSPYIAPNMDLAVHFHQAAPDSEWLLADASSPHASHGLMGCRSQVWAQDGRLLASGACQLLCRPNPAWPDGEAS